MVVGTTHRLKRHRKNDLCAPEFSETCLSEGLEAFMESVFPQKYCVFFWFFFSENKSSLFPEQQQKSSLCSCLSQEFMSFAQESYRKSSSCPKWSVCKAASYTGQVVTVLHRGAEPLSVSHSSSSVWPCACVPEAGVLHPEVWPQPCRAARGEGRRAAWM